MMRAGASLTENRFFNNCGGKLFAKTGPILLDSNSSLLMRWDNGSGLNVVYGEDIVRKVGDRRAE